MLHESNKVMSTFTLWQCAAFVFFFFYLSIHLTRQGLNLYSYSCCCGLDLKITPFTLYNAEEIPRLACEAFCGFGLGGIVQ